MLFRMVIMATIMGLEMLVPPLELISPTTCWEGPAKGEISGNPGYQEIPGR
jgi:hypothetical protein